MRIFCIRCELPLELNRRFSYSHCKKCQREKMAERGDIRPKIKFIKNVENLTVKLIPDHVDEIDYMRFWSKAELTANIDKCWNWKGTSYKGKKPYGIYVIGGRKFKAHRLAYYFQYNKDAAELGVLHKCDNHRCVNPNHLFLGDNNDNVQDKIKKGRHIRGVITNSNINYGS